MSTTFSAALTDKERLARIGKYALRRFLMPVFGFGLFIYFLPKTALFYALCGAYDVSRNRGLSATTLRRYFIGNGFFTWVVSPFNCLLDLLSLPYVNKGVYRLEDLPASHQDEIKRLIRVTNDADLVRQVEERSKEHRRAMFFWRTYGIEYDSVVNVPAYYEPWKYIKTIGLSVFNRKVTTSPHFGWLRPTFRVLYNINTITDRSAYIIVGDVAHYWCDEKLFIFDDTLLHVSTNATDQLRYCMFVDILRPSPFPWIMSAMVAVEGYLNKFFKFIRLSGWTLVEP